MASLLADRLGRLKNRFDGELVLNLEHVIERTNEQLLVQFHDIHLCVGVLVILHVQVLDGVPDHFVGLEHVYHCVDALVLLVVLSVLSDAAFEVLQILHYPVELAQPLVQKLLHCSFDLLFPAVELFPELLELVS